MSQIRPFRLRVLDAITAAMEEITIEKGYSADLSNAVFRGRIAFGETDPLPLLSILEPPIPNDARDSPAGSEANTFDWLLVIQGFVVDSPKHPTDPAHFLMADVRKRLVEERRKGQLDNNIFGMKGRVDDIVIGVGVVRPSDEISSKAYFWLNLTVKIVEDMGNPYV